jgi:hypothetical protein
MLTLTLTSWKQDGLIFIPRMPPVCCQRLSTCKCKSSNYRLASTWAVSPAAHAYAFPSFSLRAWRGAREHALFAGPNAPCSCSDQASRVHSVHKNLLHPSTLLDSLPAFINNSPVCGCPQQQFARWNSPRSTPKFFSSRRREGTSFTCTSTLIQQCRTSSNARSPSVAPIVRHCATKLSSMQPLRPRRTIAAGLLESGPSNHGILAACCTQLRQCHSTTNFVGYTCSI